MRLEKYMNHRWDGKQRFSHPDPLTINTVQINEKQKTIPRDLNWGSQVGNSKMK